MPMDFPDMKSLKWCAKAHKFRMPEDNETEGEYREKLAQHVESRDRIEAEEIRNKVGWSRFTGEQKKDMLRRNRFNL